MRWPGGRADGPKSGSILVVPSLPTSKFAPTTVQDDVEDDVEDEDGEDEAGGRRRPSQGKHSDSFGASPACTGRVRARIQRECLTPIRRQLSSNLSGIVRLAQSIQEMMGPPRSMTVDGIHDRIHRQDRAQECSGKQHLARSPSRNQRITMPARRGYKRGQARLSGPGFRLVVFGIRPSRVAAPHQDAMVLCPRLSVCHAADTSSLPSSSLSSVPSVFSCTPLSVVPSVLSDLEPPFGTSRSFPSSPEPTMRSPTLPSFHVAPSPPSTRSRPSPYLLPTASPLSSTFPSAVSSPAASPTSPTFVASGDEVSSEHHVIDVAPTPPIGSRGSPAFPRPRSLRPFLPSPFSPSSPRFDDAEPDDGEMDIADHRLADSGPTAPTVGLPLLGDDTITVARSPTFFNRPHVVSSPRLRRLVSSPNLPRSPEADGGVPVTGGLPNRKWEIVATPSEEDGSSGTIGGIVGLGLLDVDPEQQAESRHPGADDRQGEETVGLGLGFEFEGLGVEGAQGTAADLPSWSGAALCCPNHAGH